MPEIVLGFHIRNQNNKIPGGAYEHRRSEGRSTPETPPKYRKNKQKRRKRVNNCANSPRKYFTLIEMDFPTDFSIKF